MPNAIVLHESGGPEVLRYETVPVESPAAGEVLVSHSAIGVNFIDTYQRSGLYPLPSFPSGLGQEAAGVVRAVGAGVRDFAPGDRVAYASGPVGAYSEERVLSAERLVELPDDVDDQQAAASLLKGMTVEYLVQRCYRVAAGQTVLWHAAAGGVGLIACQWLAYLGVRVIGTVGTDEKAKLAARHGCTDPVVYTREDFVERVRDLTGGRGVPVVYDSVGAATLSGSLRCLQARGTLVSFGNASGKPPPLDLLELSARGSLYVTRPKLGDYTSTREERVSSARAVFEVLASGAVRATVGQRFPLEKAADAHRALESRATTGSTLLVPR
ncbi:MAG TPA: quinone oxidoreductase [Polyangiaceae bacterium]